MSGCLCLCCIFRCWCRCVRVSACYFVHSNCTLFQLICSMLFDRYDDFGFNELKRSFLPAAVYTLKLKTINIFKNYSISQLRAHALAFKCVVMYCVLRSSVIFSLAPRVLSTYLNATLKHYFTTTNALKCSN